MSPEEIREAIADDDVMPVPDGATVGSLGEDAVLLPEAQWRVLVEAARLYADLLENGHTEIVETIEATEEWEFDEVPLRALSDELKRRGYLVVPVQEDA